MWIVDRHHWTRAYLVRSCVGKSICSRFASSYEASSRNEVYAQCWPVRMLSALLHPNKVLFRTACLEEARVGLVYFQGTLQVPQRSVESTRPRCLDTLENLLDCTSNKIRENVPVSAGQLVAAGSPLPPRVPITGEYQFLLDAAVRYATWENDRLEACFSRLELPNLRKEGVPGAVMKVENEGGGFLFVNPVFPGPCLILQPHSSHENDEDGHIRYSEGLLT